MEAWRKCWRDGFAPGMSTKGLIALRNALMRNDHSLLHGATTSPPPLQCVQEWNIEAADAIAYCGWKGEGLRTVREVEEYFARACFDADKRIGEDAYCRYFLNFWDDSPMDVAKSELLLETNKELFKRFDIPFESNTPLEIVADWLKERGREDVLGYFLFCKAISLSGEDANMIVDLLEKELQK